MHIKQYVVINLLENNPFKVYCGKKRQYDVINCLSNEVELEQS